MFRGIVFRVSSVDFGVHEGSWLDISSVHQCFFLALQLPMYL